MKLPIPVRLIAAWGFLALLLQASIFSRLLGSLFSAEGQDPQLISTPLFAVALVLVIWQTVGLVRLRPFNRWFAVAFFIWWTISLVWNAVIFLQRPGTKPFRLVAAFLAIGALNLACS